MDWTGVNTVAINNVINKRDSTYVFSEDSKQPYLLGFFLKGMCVEFFLI